MKYQQFKQSVRSLALGADVKQQTMFYDSVITQTVDNYIFINGALTEFGCLEEAKQYIKQQIIQEDIHKKIQQDLYEEMSHNKIATIIKEHYGDIKVTNNLIESYLELASSKFFTTDPIAHTISKSNKLDHIVEGRIDYKLNDGTTVVITEETYQRINNMFGTHSDIIDYMRSNIDNFLDVVNALEE